MSGLGNRGENRSLIALGAAILSASFTIGASAALAEPISLLDYLASMDRAEITFSGRIKYNSTERNFTFYDDNREPFGATIDAGRDAREQIEKECDRPGYFYEFKDLCTISGSGTVEIRGSRIFISIEVVDQLGK
jgi:hypothetical protein